MNKTTITKLPKSKVEIKVEVAAEDFLIFAEKALAEIAKDVEISGFRRGTAPNDVVKSKVGSVKILDRAAMMAIEATIPGVILENKLEPLGYPEVSILKLAEGNPLEYKAVVSVYPQVDLPDYKSIVGGFELKEAIVTEEEIKRMKMEKERHSREQLREEVLAAIAQKTEVEVPEILIERETEKMMEQLKEKTPRALNMSFDEYLKKLGKTEAELKEMMAKDNEVKIKNYLVLQEIVKSGKIEVTEEEIAQTAKKEAAAHEGHDHEEIKEELDEQAKEYYRENLRTEKAFEYLEGFYRK